jgi:hypothetical protein
MLVVAGVLVMIIWATGWTWLMPIIAIALIAAGWKS